MFILGWNLFLFLAFCRLYWQKWDREQWEGEGEAIRKWCTQTCTTGPCVRALSTRPRRQLSSSTTLIFSYTIYDTSFIVHFTSEHTTPSPHHLFAAVFAMRWEWGVQLPWSHQLSADWFTFPSRWSWLPLPDIGLFLVFCEKSMGILSALRSHF